MPVIKLQVHAKTFFFGEWENIIDSEMPIVKIDEENAVILTCYQSEPKPITFYILATTMSEDDKNIKIFTVETLDYDASLDYEAWKEQLIYWDTTNKLLKFASPDSKPNDLGEYIEYQYE